MTDLAIDPLDPPVIDPLDRLAIDGLDPLDLSAIPRFTGAQETADMFNVSVASVRSGIKKGEIPATRIGRHFRIPLRAFVASLEGADVETDESAPVGEEGAPINAVPARQGGGAL